MRIRTLAGTSTATAATAVVGFLATDPDADWFRELDLPPFYPPPATFPIVWTALFADIAVTTAAAHGRLEGADRRALRRSLAVNLALNGAWSWIFWQARSPRWAALEALALAVSSAHLVRCVARAHRAAGLALAPYVAWCTFAAVLCAAIAHRNPHLQGERGPVEGPLSAAACAAGTLACAAAAGR